MPPGRAGQWHHGLLGSECHTTSKPHSAAQLHLARRKTQSWSLSRQPPVSDPTPLSPAALASGGRQQWRVHERSVASTGSPWPPCPQSGHCAAPRAKLRHPCPRPLPEGGPTPRRGGEAGPWRGRRLWEVRLSVRAGACPPQGLVPRHPPAPSPPQAKGTSGVYPSQCAHSDSCPGRGGLDSTGQPWQPRELRSEGLSWGWGAQAPM